MTYRLVTAIIFLFCGTMTALLVRSVLYPEGTGLALVSSHKPFDFFVARNEGSELDIWDRDTIIGSCRLAPHGGSGIDVRTDKVTLEVDLAVRLGEGLMESTLIILEGKVVLHADCSVDDVDLRVSLPHSLPQVNLTIKQPAGEKWPSLELSQGKDLLCKSSEGRITGGTYGWMVGAMLKSIGMPEEFLSAGGSQGNESRQARAGDVRAGGQTFDGFVLSSGADDSSRFSIFLSNTGEILRIDTPFTGTNQLGLRMLSKSLAPKDAKRPNLEKYPLRKFLGLESDP